MEELKLLVELVGRYSSLAIGVLVGIFLYKIDVVISILRKAIDAQEAADRATK